jgi:hypothetical protein
MSLTYEEFREALIARHQTVATSALSTVADGIWIATIPVGLITRSFKTAIRLLVVGYAVAVFAHFFQPGTVKEEVVSVFRHPVWAARAETTRVRSGFRRAGST